MAHNRAVDAEHDAQDSRTPPELEASSSRPRLWRRFGVWVTVGVVVYVIAGAILLVTIPDRLLAHWFPTLDESARAAFLGSAANVVLFGLGGTIAIIGVGLSLSRHRQELEAAERDRQRLIDDREREQARRVEVEAQRRVDTERALRERFVTAVKLLNESAPAGRQAALFALGALADDWDAFGKPDEVQVCIEVIAGYLRSPIHAGHVAPLERVVRQVGFRIIRTHLRPTARSGWSARRIDLGGIYLDCDVDLSGIVVMLRGVLDLQGATLGGSATLSLAGAVVGDAGVIALGGAGFLPGSTVDLEGAQITNQAVVIFDGAQIHKRNEVTLGSARLSDDGPVILPDGRRMTPLR